MIDVIAAAMPILAVSGTVITRYVLPVISQVWTITYYIGWFVIIMAGIFLPV